MRLRSLITCVLLCAVVFAPVVPAQEEAGVAESGATVERKLSPEEEREAKELAVSLMKRLRETEDFGPVVSEFVVDDFAERLRKFARAEKPESEYFIFSEQHVILRAGDDDLRRVYVALLNFWHQQELLGDAAWNYVKVKYKLEGKDALKDEGAWARHHELKERAIPREAFRVAQSEPLLEALMGFVRRREKNDDGDDDDEPEEETEESIAADEAKAAAAVIRDVARLRAFTDKVERCAALLREGVQSLRAELKSLAAAHAISDNPDEYEPRPGDPLHVYHLEGETLGNEAFGLPAGTLLIRARIRPYEMAMARLDGRLRIIGVYPDADGD